MLYQGYNKQQQSHIENNLKPLPQKQPSTKTAKKAKPIVFSKKVTPVKSIGKTRNIDIQKYKMFINKGLLSDKEAMYYKTID